MPEMPEVETVRRTLIPLVKGKTIAKIIIWYPKIIVNDPDEFVKKLTNKKILKIDRYGKYLLFSMWNLFLLMELLCAMLMYVNSEECI